MDSKLLEYFLRVSELGSINKAAADLSLSQPALSRHISALEHEIGATLFHRTQGGVKLNEAGELLADRSRPLLRQLSILKEQVGEHAAGQLAIGLPTSWQFVFTSPFSRKIIEEYPTIKLRVYEGVSHTIKEHMHAGLLDFTITPYEQSTTEGFPQTPLIREPLICVGHVDDKLDPKKPILIDKLDGVKLILPGRPNAIRHQIENTLLRRGLKFNAAIETDTLGLCLDLARHGLGYTVTPACALFNRIDPKTISWTTVKGLYLTWALWENKARSHSPAFREGKKIIFNTLYESLKNKIWLGAESITDLENYK